MAFASEKGRQGAAGVSTGFDIDNSLRFNDNDSAYLSRTPSTPSSRTTMSMSMWVKRGNLGSDQIWLFGTSGNWEGARFWNDDSLYIMGPYSTVWVTDAKFRDTSAWYHFLIVWDTTNATAADRIRFYVNGERQTFSSSPTVAQNQNTQQWNVAGDNNTIANQGTASRYLDGYLSEVHFIDGTALDPTSFGETGTYGEWKPKEVTGLTYGTNGFYLDFKLSAATSSGLGNDANGSNNWTPTNLASTDQMVDTPTNNFCTLNPLNKGSSGMNLAQGNTESWGTTGWCVIGCTHGISSGKWYWETCNPFGATYIFTGLVELDDIGSLFTSSGTFLGNTSGSYGYYAVNGETYNNGSNITYGASWRDIDDVIGTAFDADAGTLTFYKNGVSQGQAYSGVSNNCIPAFSNEGSRYQVANFGQDSSFAGNKTTGSANANDGNYGDFYYTPPSGFLALCTKNLPDPAVIPSEHFNTVAYSTSGASGQSVTGVGFQPDFVWIKGRNNTCDHRSFDAVRGYNYTLRSNSTAAEVNDSQITSFDSDGFGLSTDTCVNYSGRTFVAWNWKAGNATLGTGDFTQGSIASTCSRNVDAGFSIVSANVGTSGNVTVGHGLSKAPEMLIVKNRAAGNWNVWHTVFGNEDGYMSPNLTSAKLTYTDYWGAAVPSATVFGLKAGIGWANEVIAYCFHSVDGYSKVGSWTSNNSADGTFVYTGFKPRYIMSKQSANLGDWVIFDTERNTYNESGAYLEANTSDAEYSARHKVDILSNGFKARSSYGEFNGYTSSTQIFIAFAEVPFKFSNAR